MERTRVMDFVCGESTLQFAYHFIPKLKELDYRFFYTSNISLKRKFLVDAADDGVRFDQCFTRAAFEDSELAYRLQKRGLLSAEWRDLGGREAKFYSLTRAGRRQLDAEQESWERLAGAVAMILRTAE